MTQSSLLYAFGLAAIVAGCVATAPAPAPSGPTAVVVASDDDDDDDDDDEVFAQEAR